MGPASEQCAVGILGLEDVVGTHVEVGDGPDLETGASLRLAGLQRLERDHGGLEEALPMRAWDVDEDRDGETDYAFGDPDFAFVQFRSNLVVRWEYIPGSEIFLVWSQGINGIGDPDNDFGSIIDKQLFSARPQNTFLLKATYRFVL